MQGLKNLHAKAKEKSELWALLCNIKKLILEENYPAVIEICNTSIDLEEPPTDSLGNEFPYYMAKCDIGHAFGKLNEFRKANIICESILYQLKDKKKDAFLGIEECRTRAMSQKAFALASLNDLEKAISAYDEIIKKYKGHEIVFDKHVVDAMYGKGNALVKLGNKDNILQAKKIWSELEKIWSELELESEDKHEFRDKVTKSIRDWAGAAFNYTDIVTAIVSWEKLIGHYNNTDKDKEKNDAAMAVINMGAVMADKLKGKLLTKAIRIWKQLISAENDNQKEYIAMAMTYIAAANVELKNTDLAKETLDEIIEQYRQSFVPELRHWAAKAMVEKSYIVYKDNREEAVNLLKAAQKIVFDDDSLRQLISFKLSELSDNEGLIKLNDIYEKFSGPKGKIWDNYFTKIGAEEGSIKDFLKEGSNFRSAPNKAILFILREWNSYTPAIPDPHRDARGGGYFIRYQDKGIVIDPGYDFIKNFAEAGGRIFDIDHIVITHAHNDHTNDVESLLTLFHNYNKENKYTTKRVNLYLSQGAERKLSGFIPLRDVPYIDKIEILNPGNFKNPQVIKLHGLSDAKLTILCAYHDDLITENCSVGLGFEFKIIGKLKPVKVVFTGDTGTFPLDKNEHGGVNKQKDGVTQKLDLNIKAAIFNNYPDAFKRPDILIPHLGSIKKEECKPDHGFRFLENKEKAYPYFYPNHLGLRGLIMLLDTLRPKIAIISEFGEELRSIRFDLVNKITEVLNVVKGNSKRKMFVLPGDLTIICDIGEKEIFCHEKFISLPTDKIRYKEVNVPNIYPRIKRPYIFSRDIKVGGEKKTVENYYKHEKKCGALPYWEKWKTQEEMG